MWYVTFQMIKFLCLLIALQTFTVVLDSFWKHTGVIWRTVNSIPWKVYISSVEDNSYLDRIEPWKLLALSVRTGVNSPVWTSANHGKPVNNSLSKTISEKAQQDQFELHSRTGEKVAVLHTDIVRSCLRKIARDLRWSESIDSELLFSEKASISWRDKTWQQKVTPSSKVHERKHAQVSSADETHMWAVRGG